MITKRLWLALLILSFVTIPVCALAGSVTLDFWTGGFPKEGIKAFNDAIAQFEKTNPSIKINFTPIPFDTYRTKLASAFTVGPPPDVFIDSFQKKWNQMQALEPMEKYLQRLPFKDKLDPQGLKVLTINGVLVGLPDQGHVWTIMYNKDLFKSRGIDPNVGILKVDKLMEFAEKLTYDSKGGNTIDTWGFGLLGKTLSDQFFNIVFYSKGGLWVNEKGDFLGSEYAGKLIDTMDYFVRIAKYTPGGAKSAAGRSYGDVRPLFAAQKTAMQSDKPLELYSALTSLEPAILPKMGYWVVEKGMTSYDNLYIVKMSKHKEEAFLFVKHLLEKDFTIPTNLWSGVIPMRTDLIDDPKIKENPAAVASVKQWNSPSGNVLHPANYLTEYSQIRPYLYDAISAVLQGTKTSKQAVDEMLKNMRRELGI